jgi:hypothetical protein
MSSEAKLDNVELNLKLMPEEAIGRISSVVDEDKPFSIFRYTGDNQLIGKVKHNGFRIRLKKDYRNSWSPIFCGTVEPGKLGCSIYGKFKESWFTMLFTMVWFGMFVFFVLIGLIILYVGLVRRTFEPTVLAIILVPLCMLGFGIALRNWGKGAGKAEEEQVRKLLLELFEDVQYEKCK